MRRTPLAPLAGYLLGMSILASAFVVVAIADRGGWCADTETTPACVREWVQAFAAFGAVLVGVAAFLVALGQFRTNTVVARFTALPSFEARIRVATKVAGTVVDLLEIGEALERRTRLLGRELHAPGVTGRSFLSLAAAALEKWGEHSAKAATLKEVVGSEIVEPDVQEVLNVVIQANRELEASAAHAFKIIEAVVEIAADNAPPEGTVAVTRLVTATREIAEAAGRCGEQVAAMRRQADALGAIISRAKRDRLKLILSPGGD